MDLVYSSALVESSPDLCFSVVRKAMTSEPEAFPSVVGEGGNRKAIDLICLSPFLRLG